MLRGAKKNMIVIRTRDSRMFEEAYFVMRRNTDISDTDETDMILEANRILESASPRSASGAYDGRKGNAKRFLRALLWFISGLACGGGFMGLSWFLS